MTHTRKVRATYVVDWVSDGFIHLTDLDIGCSVTNDAEAVVAQVIALYGNHRVLYIDTMGNRDELVHENGIFKDFAPYPLLGTLPAIRTVN